MAINVTQAISAYNNAAKGVGRAEGQAQEEAAPRADGTGFADMVKDAARQAIDTQRQGESMSMAALAGKADLSQVVTAVAEAEVTVQAVVAIRDKAVEAYKDILRMPI